MFDVDVDSVGADDEDCGLGLTDGGTDHNEVERPGTKIFFTDERKLSVMQVTSSRIPRSSVTLEVGVQGHGCSI